MKIFSLFIFFSFTFLNIKAQQWYVDSLQYVFQFAKEDSTKVFALSKLSDYYSFLYPDSALYYAENLIELSNKQNYPLAKALGLIYKGEALDRVADYPAALEVAFQSLEIAKTLSTHRLFVMGRTYNLVGHLYGITGNAKESVAYLHTAANLLHESGEHPEIFYYIYFQLAYSMLIYGKPDSALYYAKKGGQFFTTVKKLRNPTPWLITGNVYRYGIGNIDSAEYYFRQGIKLSEEFNSLFISAVLYNGLADIFYEKKKMDSCVYYAQKSLWLSQKYKYKLFEINSSGLLAYIYDTINVDSAYKYMKIMQAANNEVFNAGRGQQFQKAASDAEKKQKDLEDAKTRFNNKVRIYVLITVLGFFALISIIFWRNNRQKQKANLVLETTLSYLKATQSQLIQSEKMASLGELTAGIAHEIQNPLNFVNNFSEVNAELIDEIKQALQAGNSAEVLNLAEDIKQNLEKINFHGKRADGIVKSMLQHSHSSDQSGKHKKEPTDINVLADEYLRLAYHGLRAKDKSFNATLKTDFDESIGLIQVIRQDIARAVLNLITNAFYAVNEKEKRKQPNRLPGSIVQAGTFGFEPEKGVTYTPIVSIVTRKIFDKSEGSRIEIRVKDNGPGISQHVLDKIFQPFFTTKPTGQGTGLGLSLSYDIIKAHGGEIKVKTELGEGTEFIILLPIV